MGSRLSPAALTGPKWPRMAKRESRGLERVPRQQTGKGSFPSRPQRGHARPYTDTYPEKRQGAGPRPAQRRKETRPSCFVPEAVSLQSRREGRKRGASFLRPRCLEFDSWARYLGRVWPTFNTEVRLKEEERLPGIAAPVVWEGTDEVRRPWRRGQRQLGSVVALMFLGLQGGCREAVWVLQYCWKSQACFILPGWR